MEREDSMIYIWICMGALAAWGGWMHLRLDRITRYQHEKERFKRNMKDFEVDAEELIIQIGSTDRLRDANDDLERVHF
jgi:hypothetical protein